MQSVSSGGRCRPKRNNHSEINILVIWSGSLSHRNSLVDFVDLLSSVIRVRKVDFASHIFYPNDISFMSPPAFVNAEFSISKSPFEVVRLKSSRFLYKRRKEDCLRIFGSNDSYDLLVIDALNATDLPIVKEILPMSHAKILLVRTGISYSLPSGSHYYRKLLGGYFEIRSEYINLYMRIRDFALRISLSGLDDRSQLRKLSARVFNSSVKVDEKRLNVRGFKNIPEICLSPFEFNHNFTEDQCFLGFCRNYVNQEILQEGSDIILVTVGSRLGDLPIAGKVYDFITKLAEVLPNYDVFCPEFMKGRLSCQKIHYYSFSEYQVILSKCSLMITHGGIGSIKDALFATVPFIAIPVEAKYDQVHNAMLFAKNELCRVWDVSKTDNKKIRGDVAALRSHRHREKIVAFREGEVPKLVEN